MYLNNYYSTNKTLMGMSQISVKIFFRKINYVNNILSLLIFISIIINLSKSTGLFLNCF